MSTYMIFTPPKNGVNAFLWKINELGEIVIEAVDNETHGIVSSGRAMAVLGRIDHYNFVSNLNLALSKIQNGALVIVSRPHLHHYGVSTVDELVLRLNAKGQNAAKLLVRALPSELRHKGIRWNAEEQQWEKTPESDEGESE